MSMEKTQHDSEVLADGQQVITACAFIWRKRGGVYEVLLAQRASTKKFLPGVYETIGGHIEYGENIREGVKREALEELHLPIRLGDPFYVFDYPNLIKKSHSVEIVYFAQAETDADIVLNPADHSGFGWFSEEKVRTIVAENRKDVFELGGDGSEDKIDTELEAIYRGFQLLQGSSLDYGTEK